MLQDNIAGYNLSLNEFFLNLTVSKQLIKRYTSKIRPASCRLRIFLLLLLLLLLSLSLVLLYSKNTFFLEKKKDLKHDSIFYFYVNDLFLLPMVLSLLYSLMINLLLKLLPLVLIRLIYQTIHVFFCFFYLSFLNF